MVAPRESQLHNQQYGKKNTISNFWYLKKKLKNIIHHEHIN